MNHSYIKISLYINYVVNINYYKQEELKLTKFSYESQFIREHVRIYMNAKLANQQ